MIKNLFLQILLICFILLNSPLVFAYNKVWKKAKDINLSEYILVNKNTEKIQVKKYNLKNGYTLILRPVYTEIANVKTYNTQVYLQKNNNLKLIISNKDGGDKSNYFFFYQNIDFDKYFCLSLFLDTQYFYLINKESGDIKIICYAGSVDINNNIFIYLNEDSTKQEIILYDLNTENKYCLDKFIEYGKYGSNTYWQDFVVDSITDDSYYISFFGRYDDKGNKIQQKIRVPK